MKVKLFGLFIAASMILALCSCAPVTIESTPSGAEVYDASGEMMLGTTPFDTYIFCNGKNFVLKSDLYYEKQIALPFNAARNVDATLNPIPVTLYSKPKAEVYAAGSGESLGSTPVKVLLKDAAPSYTFKLDGYYDETVSVSPETVSPVVVEMKRRPLVTISTDPAGVDIYENGKKIGTAPLTEEIEKARTFELRKENYFTKTVTLKGAPPYQVSEKLEPLPEITITATPANAQVYRNGALVGTAPVKLLVGEKMVLDIRADRYYPEAVTLTPDSPATVSTTLKAMPYVTVSSTPTAADVYVNGKKTGTTPVELLVENPTAVELRKEGFLAKTQTLTGASKNVSMTLEAEPKPETNTVVESAAPVKEEPVVEEPVAEPEVAEGGMSPVVIGGIVAAIAVIAGIIFGIMKKKK